MNSHSLHYFTICSGRAADSPLPGPQDPIKAEAPEFDMTASSSRRESPLPSSDFILPASFDLLAVQSPIMSDSSDIFHTPDLSGSDIDEGGLFLPHAVRIYSLYFLMHAHSLCRSLMILLGQDTQGKCPSTSSGRKPCSARNLKTIFLYRNTNQPRRMESILRESCKTSILCPVRTLTTRAMFGRPVYRLRYMIY